MQHISAVCCNVPQLRASSGFQSGVMLEGRGEVQRCVKNSRSTR